VLGRPSGLLGARPPPSKAVVASSKAAKGTNEVEVKPAQQDVRRRGIERSQSMSFVLDREKGIDRVADPSGRGGRRRHRGLCDRAKRPVRKGAHAVG